MPSKAEKAVERHVAMLANHIREALKDGVLTIWSEGPGGLQIKVKNVDFVLEGEDPPSISLELEATDAL